MAKQKLEERKQIAHDDVKHSNMNADREFLQSLFQAAVQSDTQTLISTIQDYGSRHGMTPYEVIVGFKDGSKRSVIHFACQSIPNPAKEEDKGETHGDDIVQSFLKEFSKEQQISLLKDVDSSGFTPLILACQNMHIKSYDRIKFILDMVGADDAATVRTHDGAAALHYASGAGASKEIIQLLYEHGKSMIHVKSKNIGTPLHWSSGVPSYHNYTETLTTLLDVCGADVNALNDQGIPALILAAANGNDVHCKVLVEHGADRGMILAGNVTVYHVAADLNMLQTLKAMIVMDAKGEKNLESVTHKCLQTKNIKGETPLDLAAQKGHFECFKLISGEENDDIAKAHMEQLHKKWIEKKKNEPHENEANDHEVEPKVSKTNFLRDEEEAHNAASRVLLTSPMITDEMKAQAEEYKNDGNLHFAKNEYEEAMAAYSKAIELNPKEATYYSNRSACFMSTKKYKEALYDAVFARTLKPDWSKACYRMSVARLALEMYEDAAVSAYEGLNIDEDNMELRKLFQKCVKKGQQNHKKMKDGK